MRAAVLLSLALAVAVGAGRSRAQMPDEPAVASAVQSLQPLAASLGLRLRLGPLWREALQARSPLVAALVGRSDCWLGYSAYAPGRDHQWLFPPLPDDQRRQWLLGAVAHELAHCAAAAEGAETADRAAAARLAGTADTAAAAWSTDELLPDLAFAWQLRQLGPPGTALVARLAQLRASRRQEDPAHDTANMLNCYLNQADTAPTAAAWPGDRRWWQALHALRARCSTPS